MIRNPILISDENKSIELFNPEAIRHLVSMHLPAYVLMCSASIIYWVFDRSWWLDTGTGILIQNVINKYWIRDEPTHSCMLEGNDDLK